MPHFYYFAFAQTPNGIDEKRTSSTIALEEPKVTMQVIAQAQLTAGALPGAFMTNCSYLGEMTVDEFQAGS